MKKNKRIKKYLTGSKINTYVEDPSTELAKNALAWEQAFYQGENDPLVRGLGITAGVLGAAGNMLYSYGGSTQKGQGQVGSVSKDLYKANKLYNNKSLTALDPILEEKARNFMSPNKFFTGGRVPAEVEGGELLEFPNGEMFDVNGPSHENGGVKGMFPEGTSVFSKELGTKDKNGKFISFADKKKAREKKLAKAVKNSEDFIGRNTKKRIEETNALEEASDMAMMQQAFEAFNSLQHMQKAATGGVLDGDNLISGGYLPETFVYEKYRRRPLKIPPINIPQPSLQSQWITPDWRPTENTFLGPKDESWYGEGGDMPAKGEYSKQGFEGWRGFDLKDSLSDFTSGDLLGFAGNAYRAFSDYIGTRKENASDSPNVNYFRDFGKDALETNREAMEYVEDIFDNSKQDIEYSTRSARSRARNSATGVNTMRALDLALETNKNRSYLDAYDTYARNMMAVLQQQANLENMQDSSVMQGEMNKDIANRQDKAARNMAMKQSKDNVGKFITSIGDLLNKSKGRKTTQKLLNSMSEFTDFDFVTGNLVGKGQEHQTDLMLQDGSWATWVFPDGKKASTKGEFKKKVKESYK